MIADLPSPNHNERDAPIDHLIVHYTGMKTAAEAIDRLRNPAPPSGHPVSAHYVVDENGAVVRLVPEDRRAWHAGVSYWRGNRALNARSIGIEIVNPGHEFGYRPFPAVQMAAVRDLCRGVLARYAIPARNVVGHSDVAPDRKQDPGELFDWRFLAEHGVGLSPPCTDRQREAVSNGADSLARHAPALAAIGYDTTLPLPLVLAAYQRHWAPHLLGTGDVGDIAAVIRLCGCPTAATPST